MPIWATFSMGGLALAWGGLLNRVKPRTRDVTGDVTGMHSHGGDRQPCGTGCVARLCSLPLAGRSSIGSTGRHNLVRGTIFKILKR